MYWIIDVHKNTYISEGCQVGNSLFQHDNWFHETQEYISFSKGVILNLNELGAQFPVECDLFHRLFQQYGYNFPKHLVGSFSGVYYHKSKNEWVVFTNHSGDQKLFYSELEGELIVSDSVFEINKILKSKGVNPQLNANACYSILSYGYLFNDDTLLQHVKRLTAGSQLVVKNGSIVNRQYYQLQNQANPDISTKDAIEQLNFLYQKAVKQEYEKDIQNKLKHIASLSGGLDSRMTCWVSDDLGFKNDLFYTFSQTGYEDMITARQIAQKLNTPWKFIPLDGGDYLKQVDFVVKESNGLVSFASSSTAYTSHKKLNMDGFGLVHTGQLGDVIIGSYCTKADAYGDGFDFQSKALSKRYIHKVKLNMDAYANTEMAYMYNRGFNGILCGNFSLQNSTEVTSPFLLPELMDFAFSLPVEMRSHHQLYKKWIIQKYPGAAQFKWEAIHAKITTPVFRYKQFQMPYQKLPFTVMKRMFRKLGITRLDKKSALENMTPFERWHLENQSLTEFVSSYFEQNLDYMQEPELKADCIKMMQEGSFSEQLQVLTLLSFAKQISQ